VKYVTTVYSARSIPTTSAIGYILYILRSLARVLVTNEPVIVEPTLLSKI